MSTILTTWIPEDPGEPVNVHRHTLRRTEKKYQKHNITNLKKVTIINRTPKLRVCELICLDSGFFFLPYPEKYF